MPTKKKLKAVVTFPFRFLSGLPAHCLIWIRVLTFFAIVSFFWSAATTGHVNAQDSQPHAAKRYFHIRVIDEETGRGVPLVELKTVNDITSYTDSAGNIAFYEPELMNQQVFFHIRSHGYEYRKDGFGFRGTRLKVVSGTKSTIKIRRVNLARRLYRITGSGIYRDTILLGLKPPTVLPELNSGLIGCDSVVNAIYRDRLYWFWGDTNRISYPLGNFQVTGATTPLPKKLDPSAGFRLNYFQRQDGFVKEMVPIEGRGPTWIFGLFVTHDQNGRQRMVAKYEKIKPPLTPYQRGLVIYNDQKNAFEKLVEFPLDAPSFPRGQSLTVSSGSQSHVYFAKPFPLVRVINRLDQVSAAENYEAWTYFKTGTKLPPPQKGAYQLNTEMLERDGKGKLVLKWRKNTQTLSPGLEKQLVNQGIIRRDESISILSTTTIQPENPKVDSGEKDILLSSGSVAWNEFRKKWILIGVQAGGSSMLGEIWFAEADELVGPWHNATKIVSHNRYSFYNPRHHPYFDQQGGKEIFFEGTYTKMFSGSPSGTPRYDYNQIMYGLDLSLIPPVN